MTNPAYARCGIENHYMLRLVLIVASILICAHAAILCQAQVHDNGWYWPNETGYVAPYYYWNQWVDQENPSFHGWHLAVDLKGKVGDPVYAIARGVVVYSNSLEGGFGPNATPGGAMVVLHQTFDGVLFKALYGHLNEMLPPGTSVAPGQVLGVMNAWGPPHVHFGIHRGAEAPEDGLICRGYTYVKDRFYGWEDPLAFLDSHFGYGRPPELKDVEIIEEAGQYDVAYFAGQDEVGNYLIGGTRFIKLTPSFETIWDKAIAGRAFRQTSDGGFIIAGGTSVMVLTKTDSDGEIEWQKTFNEEGKGSALCVGEQSSGGYLIGGNALGIPSGGTSAFAVAVDSDGDEAWRKTPGVSGYAQSYTSIESRADGERVVAGITCSGVGCVPVLNVISEGPDPSVAVANFSVGEIDSSFTPWVENTADGGLIFSCTLSPSSGDRDIFIAKLKADDTIEWKNTTIDGDDDAAVTSITQTVDGGYVGCGFKRYASGGSDAYIFKLDVVGALMWERTIAVRHTNIFYSIQQLNDGGYIAAGFTSDGDYDILIAVLEPEQPYDFSILRSVVDSGDLDGDGKTDVLDVRLFLEIVRGGIAGTAEQRARLDLDCDGDIDIDDVKILAEYIIGIRTTLP